MSSSEGIERLTSARCVARVLGVDKIEKSLNEGIELDVLTSFGRKKAVLYGKGHTERQSFELTFGDLIAMFPTRHDWGVLDIFEVDPRNVEIIDRPQQWSPDTSIRLKFSTGRMLFHPGNEHSISVLRLRHSLLKELRRVFWADGYLEVETPVFEEWHSDAWITAIGSWPEDRRTKWSVASEQYLATFLLQPIQKVFEIRHHFRPDLPDFSHQPEFTVLQGFCAMSETSEVLSFIHSSLKKVIEHIQLECEKINDKNALSLKSSWAKDSFDGAHIRELREELSTELWLDNLEIASFFPLVAPNKLDKEILIDEVYAESRQYGMQSAVGFVIGVDRLLAALVGCSISEVSMFEW